MAVELIDFYRPDVREKNLYLTGIPAVLQSTEKWVRIMIMAIQPRAKVLH